MFKKGSKLYSILTGTCPKCQQESMYRNKNIFNLNKLLKMNEHCRHCGLRYEIEPSFFYGAMYVSYALNVAIGITTFIVSFVILNRNLKEAFVAIIASILILFPWVMRWSRNIYINIFVSFEKKT